MLGTLLEMGWTAVLSQHRCLITCVGQGQAKPGSLRCTVDKYWLLQIGELEQELVWSLLAKPPAPPPEAKSNQAPDSGLFESSGTRGYTAGGPLSEKWSEIFPQEQSRRGIRLDDKSWTSYLRLMAQPHSPIASLCWLFNTSH